LLVEEIQHLQLQSVQNLASH